MMKNSVQELLYRSLSHLQQQGLINQGIVIDIDSIKIDQTKQKEHGDFASNIALIMAKPCQMQPRKLAELIIEHLPEHNYIKKVALAGPGFINFYINDDYLNLQVMELLRSDNLGIDSAADSKTIIVDYSSTNLAKEMHVGHLRSTIIGDVLVNILTLLGHKVIKQNHVGDWGTQFGMLLAYLAKLNDTPNLVNAKLEDLEVFYQEAKKCFDDSAEFANSAREMVVKLQNGDQQCYSLWQQFRKISLQHSQIIYDKLGSNLTPVDVCGESFYNDDLANIINTLEQQHLITIDNGAKCIFLEEFCNKEGKPLPMIVQKQDGGYLYATTDLAALKYRVASLHADRIIYVVDQRQELHFKQLFAAASKAKFISKDTIVEHIGFGTVNGEDGKPFKTRSGVSVKLSDLINTAVIRAHKLVLSKNPNMPAKEIEHIAASIGVSAIKYADLSKHRESDYIFSFDKMLSFEGNTAPYIMYAYTRIASILRKANTEGITNINNIHITDIHEEDLAKKLLQFNEIIHIVAHKCTPNVLCKYLYDLCVIFSKFYESCPILQQNINQDVTQTRLCLAMLTAKTIKMGLGLLGINTLEKM